MCKNRGFKILGWFRIGVGVFSFSFGFFYGFLYIINGEIFVLWLVFWFRDFWYGVSLCSRFFMIIL